VWKAFEFEKAFENRQDRPWRALKINGCCVAHFSKENCLIGKIFGGFQNRQVGSVRLSKALRAAPINLLSNRSKGLEFAGVEKLFANSIAVHAKRLKND
jgi:hypothetical protein